MIFHEIYGCYYLTVEKIIDAALHNTLDNQTMYEIIQQYAFQESFIEIESKLKKQWPLLTENNQSVLKHSPHRPITTLEKRWLKSLSLDPRIQLFSVPFDFLDDVEPLFTQDDYIIYDQYQDGDNYLDETYIHNFQTILYALEHHLMIDIVYQNKQITCFPYKLEYSLKDDKFRLKTSNDHFYKTLNLSKITTCKLNINQKTPTKPNIQYKSIIIELYDERNALERAMLQFADLKKQAEKIDEHTYRIQLFYQKEDETELVIRILSFGPMIKVLEPQSFVNLIKERLYKQLGCELH